MSMNVCAKKYLALWLFCKTQQQKLFWTSFLCNLWNCNCKCVCLTPAVTNRRHLTPQHLSWTPNTWIIMTDYIPAVWTYHVRLVQFKATCFCYHLFHIVIFWNKIDLFKQVTTPFTHLTITDCNLAHMATENVPTSITRAELITCH